MNPLQRTVIEKTGHDFGFEYTVSETVDAIVLGSANHKLQAAITIADACWCVQFPQSSHLLKAELTRNFSCERDEFNCTSEDKLARLLRRASALACSLPNQVETDYEKKVERALGELPDGIKGTEVERMVRQRLGQQTYRNAMLKYWGNACAVTGVELRQVLRASHAKPWAECSSDSERLDVFNGFLLTANLDALFDRFLISFDQCGEILISESVSTGDRIVLGIEKKLRLRWLSSGHRPFLEYHRNIFYRHSS
tara:strand:- start:1990 stop:2751 length:762 start_codon:yes stop_codon:yes gene_type:complete